MQKNPKNDKFLGFFKSDLKVCESKVVCGIVHNLTRNRTPEDTEKVEFYIFVIAQQVCNNDSLLSWIYSAIALLNAL